MGTIVHPMKVEMVPVEQLVQHPANANNGDMDALDESMETNGFFDPIKVQLSTHHILAGNHRFMVALRRGMPEVPVIYLDVSDEAALRIMLADNRITRLGFDDEPLLANVLEELNDTELGLQGTGFDVPDLVKILAEINEPLDFGGDEVVDNAVDNTTLPKGMHVSVTPLVAADGEVYELAIERDGMGAMTKNDANAVRKALGLDPFTKEEIEAFNVPSWTRRSN